MHPSKLRSPTRSTPGPRPRALIVAALTGLLLALLPATVPASQAAITAADRMTRAQVSHGNVALRTRTAGDRGMFGVASFNSFKGLTRPQARRDAAALTRRGGLHVIGWQEAHRNPPRTLRMTGWKTVQPRKRSGAFHELAVSYRTDKFTLVDTDLVRMHDGLTYDRGNDRSHPPRYVQKVVLARTARHPRDRVTVYNTHVNQRIEAYHAGRPGTPYRNINAARAKVHLAQLQQLVADTDTRYTVVVGDFNWDHVADQRTLRGNFVEGRIGEVAVSGWEAFGVANQAASHPKSRRRIDYVFVSRRSPVKFRKQVVVTGLRSDHRPVLARLALS